jgi:Uma2 family endonuclease
MATTTAALLSFEEFERLPERPGKRELLKGDLIELPPPECLHNESAHQIYDALKAALAEAHSRGESGELGRVYIEMGYLLPGDGWLQPDVSVTQP